MKYSVIIFVVSCILLSAYSCINNQSEQRGSIKSPLKPDTIIQSEIEDTVDKINIELEKGSEEAAEVDSNSNDLCDLIITELSWKTRAIPVSDVGNPKPARWSNKIYVHVKNIGKKDYNSDLIFKTNFRHIVQGADPDLIAFQEVFYHKNYFKTKNYISPKIKSGKDKTFKIEYESKNIVENIELVVEVNPTKCKISDRIKSRLLNQSIEYKPVEESDYTNNRTVLMIGKYVNK